MDNKIDDIEIKALFSMTYGMYIVSTEFEGKKNGQIANTVMQITSDPISIATCLNKVNYTEELIHKSGVLTFSVLEQAVPMTFIGQFGFKCGRDLDKFQGVNYITGTTGAPMITDWSLSVIEARVEKTVDMPTHTLFICRVVGAKWLKEGMPLTYADYHLVKKGKSPKSAPTFGFNELK